MSAIAGVINLDQAPINVEYGQAIMDAWAHFPSDDRQMFNKDHVFLGCHAQWITPESVGEQMPYCDYERQLFITADAIIDNREELCERFQIKTYDRQQVTDSQLILLAYEKWGEDAPKHLIGDFAFMIWDEKQQRLFGARDMSGYRTLYYFKDQTRFVFASTIQPFFTLPFLKKELNESWLAEYLAITGMVDSLDAVATPYKNISQIPPAHFISIVGDTIKVKRYGSLFSEDKLTLKSDAEYIEAFTEVLTTAVRDRVRTHRNVGAQLSGGLDSGSVASIAHKRLRDENKNLHTFSYIPPKDFIDYTNGSLAPNETPYINSTLQYMGASNHHFLDFKGKDSYSIIEDFIEDMEMPYKFFENSFWLKGMFEEAEKQDIGILLNGDRGNFTVSWGSALDYYAKLLKKFNWIKLYSELNHYSSVMQGRRFGLLPLITKTAFPKMDYHLNSGNKKYESIINSDFARRSNINEKLKTFEFHHTGWLPPDSLDNGRKKLFNELHPWNFGNTLTSKLSLKHNLWKRDPTNDLRVIRFCLSVPDNQYIQKGMDRALIRRATKGILPDDVRLNQRVRGAQGLDWVHRVAPYWDEIVEESKIMIKDEYFSQYVNTPLLKEALSAFERGPDLKKGTNKQYRLMMRNLITYRFLKKFA